MGHLRRNEAVGTVSGVPPIASEICALHVALSRRGADRTRKPVTRPCGYSGKVGAASGAME